MRRLRAAVAVALALALLACAPSGDPDERAAAAVAPTRGILLISLDTLRADRLGLYGHDAGTSPFLDRLAERAIVYENAFAQFPSTLTSHMSMLTGLYPGEHGVYPPNGLLPESIPTLAERLQQAGRHTAGFTEGGYVRGRFGFRRGFGQFKARDREGGGRIEPTQRTFRQGVRFLETLVEEAAAEQRGVEPWFLFLHTYAVHAPYEPSEESLASMWQGPAPADAFPPLPRELAAANNDGRPVSEEALRWYRALYDAEILDLDRALEGLFRELERLGLRDDLTVIVTSDHGEEFREHGRFNHEQLYRETIRVPFLLLHPQAAARRSERVVELVDVVPTVLELAGVDGAAELPGVSLAPELQSDPTYPKRLAYSESDRRRRSLHQLDGDRLLHLLRFDHPERRGVTGGELELYQPLADPLEADDLAAVEAELRDRLAQRLAAIEHLPRADRETGELDDDTRSRLEALGYLQ